VAVKLPERCQLYSVQPMSHRDGGPSGSQRRGRHPPLGANVARKPPQPTDHTLLDLEARCPGLCRLLGAGGRLGGNASSRSAGAGCLSMVRIRNTYARICC
jgi:hypothetical protein